jgi:hypothetical protein
MKDDVPKRISALEAQETRWLFPRGILTMVESLSGQSACPSSERPPAASRNCVQMAGDPEAIHFDVVEVARCVLSGIAAAMGVFRY